MVTLTRRDWNLLKYPTYPDIQFAAEGKRMQIQTMVKIDDEGYYLPCIVIRDIVGVDGLAAMGELVKESAINILATYKINEEDVDLHKVTE